jgi:hypothetical protein
MTVQASFEAQVLLGSEITVPVEMLSGMVKQFPAGSITLNRLVRESTVQTMSGLAHKRTHTRLNGRMRVGDSCC